MKFAVRLLILATLTALPASAQSLEVLTLNDLRAFSNASSSWRVVGGAWGLWDSKILETSPGTGILLGRGNEVATEWEHGDLELEMEYMAAAGAEAGILLQGRYEVSLSDSWGVRLPNFRDAGGIAAGVYAGHAPRTNASRAPGLWQHLRIVFRSPRFDNDGRKTENARIDEVALNGVTVQKGVELPGPTRDSLFPDEKIAGPLVFKADGAAFRNIRYRHFEPVQAVRLTSVRFKYFQGEFGSLDELASTQPTRAGEMHGYVWDLFGLRADRFGTRWTGTLHVPKTGEYEFAVRFNWIDEIPYNEDAVPGRGLLTIDGEEVVVHTGADSTASGKVFLEEGAHPVSLAYFKNRRLWRPIVFLRVTGPGMAPQYLNAPRSLPEPESSAPPTPVDPAKEAYVLRSFVDFGDKKKTEAASIGDPVGVHYTVDLETGGLLYAWKGDFADVGSMWYSRGERQVAEPLGQLILFPDGPSIAKLDDASAPWPDAPSDYRRKGYTIDDAGQPTFRYEVAGVDVNDRFEPNSRTLTRHLALAGDVRNLWLRIASGSIEERSQDVYDIDGTYFIRASDATVRRAGAREELLVPIRSQSSQADLSYTIVW